MIKENLDFTIVIPSKNSVKYIKSSIDSVLCQKSVVQLIVKDSNSKDGTQDLIKKYIEKEVQVFIEKDHGQPSAINKGLLKSKGPVFQWLNSDDYYYANALKIVRSHFDQKTLAVGGRSRIFDEKGTKYYSNGTDIYTDNLPKTIGWARIDQPETFFRKQVWDKVGQLNEDLHYVFDREWWIRYLFHYGLEGFKKIPDMLVNFRHHDDSKTVSRKSEFVKESRQIYAAYAKHISDNLIEDLILGSEEVSGKIHLDIPDIVSTDFIRSMLHYHLLLLGNEYYAQNNKTKASSMLDIVDLKYLEKADSKLLSKLKFRIGVPNSIIKIARRFSSS